MAARTRRAGGAGPSTSGARRRAAGPARAPATCRRGRGRAAARAAVPSLHREHAGRGMTDGLPQVAGPSAMRPASRSRSAAVGASGMDRVRAGPGRERRIRRGRRRAAGPRRIVSPSCRTIPPRAALRQHARRRPAGDRRAGATPRARARRAGGSGRAGRGRHAPGRGPPARRVPGRPVRGRRSRQPDTGRGGRHRNATPSRDAVPRGADAGPDREPRHHAVGRRHGHALGDPGADPGRGHRHDRGRARARAPAQARGVVRTALDPRRLRRDPVGRRARLGGRGRPRRREAAGR
jgi:hypothetical protein